MSEKTKDKPNEIVVINRINRQLLDLDPDGRRRVLRYLVDLHLPQQTPMANGRNSVPAELHAGP